MEPTTLREQTTAAEPPPEPRSPAAPAKHPRERIQDFLADEPGASITRIAAHLGMTQQNTRRHLDYLAKDSRVRNEHVGRTKHYYLSNQTALHICLHPYLSVPALHRIAKTLIDDPSRHWTTNKLSKVAGSTFAPTKRFLAILEQKGLLESPGSEKNRQVHATDRLVAVCRAHKKRFGSPRRRSRGGNARRCGS